jgi:hypothetical protein
MTLPHRTDAHRKLDTLVGTWHGEERLHPSPMAPNGDTALGTVRNVLALDGFAVVQDYEQSRDGKVAFRGHGIFRFDQESGDYLLHSFDSSGQAPGEFRGAFVDGVLTLGASREQGHARAVFDFRAAGKYRYLMEVSSDGRQWHPYMEGTYTK